MAGVFADSARRVDVPAGADGAQGHQLLPGQHGEDPRQHRHLVDRARRRHADAVAVPPEAAPHVEELQAAHLHGGPDGGQLHPDEEGLEDVPLPLENSRRGGGGRDGECGAEGGD